MISLDSRALCILLERTYLASYDVNSMGEKVSFPEEKDEGGPREICENFGEESDGEEKTLK